MKAISIHDFLWDSSKYPPKPICALFGEDEFLKFQATQIIRGKVLTEEDSEFSFSRFEGSSVKFIDVLKEATTMSMFGGDLRLVMVEEADPFVSRYRSELEDYAETPSPRAVLLLILRSFPSNTRLFKRVAETGLAIEAKPMSEKELPKWIVQWSRHRHQVKCDPDAAELILHRVGPEHGMLDQELAKLALMVPPKGTISLELVRKAVGSWRTQSAFKMLDLALSGQTAAAIRQLDHLLLSGENPVGIFAQVAYSIRKLAAATRLILDAENRGKKLSVSNALTQAGVNKFFLADTEKHLKFLGRRRGSRLLKELLQADLDLKGASRSQPRLILETFIIRISNPKLR